MLSNVLPSLSHRRISPATKKNTSRLGEPLKYIVSYCLKQ